MDIEGVKLSEITQTDKDTYYMLSFFQKVGGRGGKTNKQKKMKDIRKHVAWKKMYNLRAVN